MSLKIVLADDHEEQGDFLAERLRKRGYDVEIFRAGREVLRSLRKREELPDVVLLDIMMPEASGIEISEYLKSAGHTRNIPLIAVSSTLSGRGVANALAAGFDAICPKPVDIDRLVEQITSLTSGKS